MTSVRLLPGTFSRSPRGQSQVLHGAISRPSSPCLSRERGLHPTAAPLGGWEKPDCEFRGHFVGHYLSACALSYASTADKELKSARRLSGSRTRPMPAESRGGYLSAFPTEYFDRLAARKKVWAPFYTVHKIMAGLLDMYQLAAMRRP